MRKFLIVCVLILSCSCSAFAEGLKIGMLSKAGNSNIGRKDLSQQWRWTVMKGDHGDSDTYLFYDDLAAMLMALVANEVDEIALPEPVAEYFVDNNPDYEISCVIRSGRYGFVFGFLDSNDDLRKKFDETLLSMRADRTLERLENEYLGFHSEKKEQAVKFDHFPGAGVIKVALTGDVPPIDYVAPDGNPAGFNTAVLAEIGRRLKINISTTNVHAVSRAAALASGRAAAVFWFIAYKFDMPENIKFSVPYCEFNTFLHVRAKK